MGFAFKKILKWMLIIVGFLAGMFVGVQLLQKYGYMSAVNWDKLGNDTSTQIQHFSANINVTNVHSLFHTLGIPVSGGFGSRVPMRSFHFHPFHISQKPYYPWFQSHFSNTIPTEISSHISIVHSECFVWNHGMVTREATI
jgi:hypothetical protein